MISNLQKENQLKPSQEGILIVNKPSGMTSHDVVSFVRRKFNMRQVGHAGTLDPLATGVLIILLGRSTKLFSKFVTYDKAYQATLILGIKTKTADIQGEIIARLPYDHVTQEKTQEVIQEFIGDIEQIPPMVSAIKIRGKRLYQLAREGIEVEREPRKIKIKKLQLTDFQSPQLKFYLECSKGTYVRKLAEDIGERLGCGACITKIERTKVGPFGIEDAVTLSKLTEAHIIKWQE